MYFQAQCSRCGHRSRKHAYDSFTPSKPADEVIKAGWNSFGDALYCKECARTWNTRNGANRPLWGDTHTRIVVYERMIESLYEALEGYGDEMQRM